MNPRPTNNAEHANLFKVKLPAFRRLYLEIWCERGQASPIQMRFKYHEGAFD